MSTEATYISLIFTTYLPQILLIIGFWWLVLGVMIRFLRSI